MEVNLFGVMNGVYVFLLWMIVVVCFVVVINIGLKQGIIMLSGNVVYNISKVVVKVMMEMLVYDLCEVGVEISVYLFVSGFMYIGMIQKFMFEKFVVVWLSE